MATEIINKSLKEIKPYENNPRKNDKSVNAVAKSIEQFGFKVPIVIDSNNQIVCGHTRFNADNIVKLACSKKFKSASSQIKQATLEKYFDVKKLFGEFTPDTLPTKNIRTYCKVEKTW